VEIQALCDKVNQLIISEGIEIENGRTSSLVTPRNIRYYCTIGIMPPPKRLDSKSTYDDSHVEAVVVNQAIPDGRIKSQGNQCATAIHQNFSSVLNSI